MEKEFDIIKKAVEKNNRFLVVSHVSPEGDAVGSLLGVYHILKNMGKDVVPFLQDMVPRDVEFLPGAKDIKHTLENEEPFDVTFAVDCGEKHRFGDKFMDFGEHGLVLNIDHHITNTNFGDVNVVFGNASSTGEVLYDIFTYCDFSIDEDIATCLYTAIITDTGNFNYESASAKAHMNAGELVSLGAKPQIISQNLYERFPEAKFHLMSRVLSTLTLIEGNPFNKRVAMLNMTLKMLEETGADKSLSDGFVNYARSIEGVEASFLMSEANGNLYKISFRSKGKINVAQIAQSLGGGGHRNASGATVEGSFTQVKEKILKAIEEGLKDI